MHEGNCVYRNPDGLRCAAGVLIPDDLYNPGIEGDAAEHLEVWDEMGYSEDEIELIVELQYIHDQTPVDQWTKAFSRLAARHELQDITP